MACHIAQSLRTQQGICLRRHDAGGESRAPVKAVIGLQRNAEAHGDSFNHNLGILYTAVLSLESCCSYGREGGIEHF